MVRRSLYFGNGRKYGLCAFCILPNHVHMLITPFDSHKRDACATSQHDACGTSEQRECLEPGEIADTASPLSVIMHSLKSYTAHEANKLLGRAGSFWQHESYDHWVRDEGELERIVAYINANPVKAGLADRPYEFYWCSAHDRYLQDGNESGWLEIGTTETVVLREEARPTT